MYGLLLLPMLVDHRCACACLYVVRVLIACVCVCARNRLRALPLEFAEVLESVATVGLNENPWTDLPPRWGKLWPGKHAPEGPDGYNGE